MYKIFLDYKLNYIIYFVEDKTLREWDPVQFTQ